MIISHIKYLISVLFLSFLIPQQVMPTLYFDDSKFIKEHSNNYQQSIHSSFLSLAVPGLGQCIQGRKKIGLTFIAIELGLIYLNQIYSQKGDENVLEYKDFANNHWNFENWILNYNNDLWSNPNSEFYDMFSDPQNGNWKQIWDHSHYIGFYVEHEDFQGLYYTNQDDAFGYNLYQEFINHGIGFSEEFNVSIIKDHHFYEGIRKYNMFFAGWDDSGEIQVESNGGYRVAVSPNKNKYNSVWNESIDFYDYAEYAITGIYLNHLISALEIYIKNKFDNRFDLNSSYSYNKYSESINYSLMLNINLK
tara:strand:+ start:402 stop:1319 length:918 start_codon:yes stop_codon:yes gene_type:complete